MVGNCGHRGSCAAAIRGLMTTVRWKIPAYAGMTTRLRHCERSEAILWVRDNNRKIASSLSLLAMTG